MILHNTNIVDFDYIWLLSSEFKESENGFSLLLGRINETLNLMNRVTPFIYDNSY